MTILLSSQSLTLTILHRGEKGQVTFLTSLICVNNYVCPWPGLHALEGLMCLRACLQTPKVSQCCLGSIVSVLFTYVW